MKAVSESFACSASSAVNKIEPRRALRARRVMGNRTGVKADTVPLRTLRLIKNKTAKDAKDAESDGE